MMVLLILENLKRLVLFLSRMVQNWLGFVKREKKIEEKRSLIALMEINLLQNLEILNLRR